MSARWSFSDNGPDASSCRVSVISGQQCGEFGPESDESIVVVSRNPLRAPRVNAAPFLSGLLTGEMSHYNGPEGVRAGLRGVQVCREQSRVGPSTRLGYSMFWSDTGGRQ